MASDWLGRVGDSPQWHNTSDRLQWAEYGGSLRSVYKQRRGGKGAAETQGKDRTQVGAP